MQRFLGLPRFRFDAANVTYAPDWAGVYGLFDGGELIYVGKANGNGLSVRDCLQQRLLGDCTQIASHYTWELTRWPDARETEILAGYHKSEGHEPRCQQKVA